MMNFGIFMLTCASYFQLIPTYSSVFFSFAFLGCFFIPFSRAPELKDYRINEERGRNLFSSFRFCDLAWCKHIQYQKKESMCFVARYQVTIRYIWIPVRNYLLGGLILILKLISCSILWHLKRDSAILQDIYSCVKSMLILYSFVGNV